MLCAITGTGSGTRKKSDGDAARSAVCHGARPDVHSLPQPAGLRPQPGHNDPHRLRASRRAPRLSARVRNRQAAFQQAKADHDFNEQELELKTNTELTREIHTLTTELHRRLLEEPTR